MDKNSTITVINNIICEYFNILVFTHDLKQTSKDLGALIVSNDVQTNGLY